MKGKLPENVLEVFLETLPFEFTVIDENDRVLGWNNHEARILQRPEEVIGEDLRSCHPEKSLPKIEQLLKELKEGKRDTARFWIDLSLDPESEKQKFLVEYYALRDSNGKYMGCLETFRNITEIQKLTGEKRTLD